MKSNKGLALSAVFVKPSAIVIDKHKTFLNFINKIISNDIHCWSFVNPGKVQIADIFFIFIFMW